MIRIEYNPEFEENLNNFITKYKPELFIFLLSFLGASAFAQIGADFFDNKYIAVQFIIIYLILVFIGYLGMKHEQKHGR